MQPNHGAFLCRFLGFLKALVTVNFLFQTARSPLFLAAKTMTMDQVSEGFWVKYFFGLASLWTRNIPYSCLKQTESSHLCNQDWTPKEKESLTSLSYFRFAMYISFQELSITAVLVAWFGCDIYSARLLTDHRKSSICWPDQIVAFNSTETR